MEGGNPNVDSSDVQAKSTGESDKLSNNNRVGLRADASLGLITVGPRRISKRTVIKQGTEKVTETETGTAEQKVPTTISSPHRSELVYTLAQVQSAYKPVLTGSNRVTTASDRFRPVQDRSGSIYSCNSLHID